MLTTVEEKTFAGLTTLEILALDNNVLTSFHRLALAGTHQLSRLYLNDNKLKTLENNTLQYIESIAYIIDLSHNQWECTCNLQWLAKWVKGNEERMINLEKTTCLDPKTLPVMLESKCDPSNGANSVDEHSIWINVLGIVLGIVSV
uniref:LRRCT domain-containing protein n=1 Tax=Plectus sambesii TaxID=2011161 RepID=A0A914VLX9_9BILA